MYIIQGLQADQTWADFCFLLVLECFLCTNKAKVKKKTKNSLLGEFFFNASPGYGFFELNTKTIRTIFSSFLLRGFCLFMKVAIISRAGESESGVSLFLEARSRESVKKIIQISNSRLLKKITFFVKKFNK